MAAPAGSAATWNDIAHLPKDENVQVIGGEVVLAWRSTHPHGRVQMALCASIGLPFDIGNDPGAGGMLVSCDPFLTCGP